MGQMSGELLERLNRQGKKLDNLYYSIAVFLGLSENAFWVLYILSDTAKQYSQQDICDEWSFSKQTVNSTIRGLIAKGFVYLERAPDSLKRKNVKLTDKGTEFVRKNFQVIRKVEEKALLRMTEQERESYLTLSMKYVAYLDEEMNLFYQGGKSNV